MQQAAPTIVREDALHDRCTSNFRTVIQRHEGRWTSARQRLLLAVCSMKGHFRLEDLTKQLATDGVRLSQATLYRSLPLLEEAGVIRRALHLLTTARDGAVFEHVDQTHHDHLVCSSCGRTVEFEYPAIEVLQEAVAREHGFVLQRHHLELVGICATCRDARLEIQS